MTRWSSATAEMLILISGQTTARLSASYVTVGFHWQRAQRGCGGGSPTDPRGNPSGLTQTVDCNSGERYLGGER
jgi:hypothetical protein